ncbi:hypothetical protein GCM10008179_12420 [Hansschlegelia plantiphila]|uniref:Uncharacterized protein n=1 Tax=Hansschlegelia plantiphila TaxID=374655 RepID=A0A9W6J1L5_9HYPH|nr:hypothetical protein GCM10008179_12420 [Hansschlegelia plantiphila]
MLCDRRSFRVCYAEAAGALRRRRAARIALLLVLITLLAIVARALSAPPTDATLNRPDTCQHNLAPCSIPH